jgi:hypothetical protein
MLLKSIGDWTGTYPDEFNLARKVQAGTIDSVSELFSGPKISDSDCFLGLFLSVGCTRCVRVDLPILHEVLGH